MNITHLIISQALSTFVVLSTLAQGTFRNLNFEQADPIFVGPAYPGFVTASSALPYWTATVGGVQQTDIGYNFASTGAPIVSLVGPGGPVPVIDGNYSVELDAFTGGASISQTGLIPALTQSLFFEVGTYLTYDEDLEVLVGGENVPFTAVGTGANFILYGANVSAWAGQTEQLTFSALPDFSEPNSWLLDDIFFSPNAVPEPNTLALVVVGGIASAAWRWRTKRS